MLVGIGELGSAWNLTRERCRKHLSSLESDGYISLEPLVKKDREKAVLIGIKDFDKRILQLDDFEEDMADRTYRLFAREIFDLKLFSEEKYTKADAYFYLFWNAQNGSSYRLKKRGFIPLEIPDEYLFVTVARLSAIWQWSPKTVRAFLRHLEKAGEIVIKPVIDPQKKTKLGRLLHIANYRKYILDADAMADLDAESMDLFETKSESENDPDLDAEVQKSAILPPNDSTESTEPNEENEINEINENTETKPPTDSQTAISGKGDLISSSSHGADSLLDGADLTPDAVSRFYLQLFEEVFGAPCPEEIRAKVSKFVLSGLSVDQIRSAISDRFQEIKEQHKGKVALKLVHGAESILKGIVPQPPDPPEEDSLFGDFFSNRGPLGHRVLDEFKSRLTAHYNEVFCRLLETENPHPRRAEISSDESLESLAWTLSIGQIFSLVEHAMLMTVRQFGSSFNVNQMPKLDSILSELQEPERLRREENTLRYQEEMQDRPPSVDLRQEENLEVFGPQIEKILAGGNRQELIEVFSNTEMQKALNTLVPQSVFEELIPDLPEFAVTSRRSLIRLKTRWSLRYGTFQSDEEQIQRLRWVWCDLEPDVKASLPEDVRNTVEDGSTCESILVEPN